MLAERTRKRLRFAILRPKNQQAVKPYLDTLPEQIQKGLPSEQFDLEVNTLLGPTFIFVGCIKHKCKKLFDCNGFPTGDELQPGDVLDDINEFRERLKNGAYVPEGHDRTAARLGES
jgi:hypothetical protein